MYCFYYSHSHLSEQSNKTLSSIVFHLFQKKPGFSRATSCLVNSRFLHWMIENMWLVWLQNCKQNFKKIVVLKKKHKAELAAINFRVSNIFESLIIHLRNIITSKQCDFHLLIINLNLYRAVSIKIFNCELL